MMRGAMAAAKKINTKLLWTPHLGSLALAHARAGQAEAALEQAQANLEQGKANRDLAKTTSERWSAMAKRGIVPRQDADQYEAQFAAQTANVQALEKAVSAQRSNIAAAKANEISRFSLVKAFALQGVEGFHYRKC